MWVMAAKGDVVHNGVWIGVGVGYERAAKL